MKSVVIGQWFEGVQRDKIYCSTTWSNLGSTYNKRQTKKEIRGGIQTLKSQNTN